MSNLLNVNPIEQPHGLLYYMDFWNIASGNETRKYYLELNNQGCPISIIQDETGELNGEEVDVEQITTAWKKERYKLTRVFYLVRHKSYNVDCFCNDLFLTAERAGRFYESLLSLYLSKQIERSIFKCVLEDNKNVWRCERWGI